MRHEKRAHTLPTAGLEVSLTLVSSACKHVVAMVGGLAGEDRVPHHQLSTQGRRPLHRWHPRSSRRGARSSTAQPQSRCAHQTRLHSMESVIETDMPPGNVQTMCTCSTSLPDPFQQPAMQYFGSNSEHVEWCTCKQKPASGSGNHICAILH